MKKKENVIFIIYLFIIACLNEIVDDYTQRGINRNIPKYPAFSSQTSRILWSGESHFSRNLNRSFYKILRAPKLGSIFMLYDPYSQANNFREFF